VHHPSADPDEIVIDDGAMQPHARATRAGHAETRFPALHKCLPRRDCLEVRPSPRARSRPNPRVCTSSSTFPPSHQPQPQPRPHPRRSSRHSTQSGSRPRACPCRAGARVVARARRGGVGCAWSASADVLPYGARARGWEPSSGGGGSVQSE